MQCLVALLPMELPMDFYHYHYYYYCLPLPIRWD